MIKISPEEQEALAILPSPRNNTIKLNNKIVLTVIIASTKILRKPSHLAKKLVPR